ncbi:MAG: hypothetical protein JWP93_1543 [Polaromonas sp.]|nr:hypothetical protein [Polaromonas sp.]
MTNHKKVKPDLSVGHGGWVDPEFIPDSVRRELLLHLNLSALTDEQKESLLTHSNDMAQMVIDGELESGKRQREQIEAVATNAKRLLSSLTLLSQSARDTLHAHTDYLAYGSAPPVELDRHIKTKITQPGESLLSSAWDWVEALETASNYATQQFDIDKTSKPEQMRARGLVSILAERVREMTGSLPPKDAASWFAGFAECLGNQLQMRIGSRIVKSGIDAIR